MLAFKEKPPVIVSFPTKILWFGNTMLYSQELEMVAMSNFLDISFEYGRSSKNKKKRSIVNLNRL